MTVLCVGEPLVVLSPPSGQPLTVAGDCTLAVGGAELNVAIHLARLGLPVRYASAVGDDPLGARVRRELLGEGVDASGLLTDPERQTGLYLKDHEGHEEHLPRMYYYRTGSAACSYAVSDHPGVLDGVTHVHLSGISPALSATLADTVATLLDRRRDGVRVSFDVNYRSVLWSPDVAAPALLELARRCDLVLVGLDEARALWGAGAADDVRALLPDVPELVVKNDAEPSHAWSGTEHVVTRPPEVTVVEPIGAGDAFAAGYLAARIGGHAPDEAARRGHALAAHVLTSTSDNGTRGADVYAELGAVPAPTPARNTP